MTRLSAQARVHDPPALHLGKCQVIVRDAATVFARFRVLAPQHGGIGGYVSLCAIRRYGSIKLIGGKFLIGCHNDVTYSLGGGSRSVCSSVVSKFTKLGSLRVCEPRFNDLVFAYRIKIGAKRSNRLARVAYAYLLDDHSSVASPSDLVITRSIGDK